MSLPFLLHIPLCCLYQLLLELVDVLHLVDSLHLLVPAFIYEAYSLVVRVVEM